ncbi:MAG: shikimate kinase [Kocuria sp.]|nr:shikimate kinase [Kocuria sp.]
MTSLPTPLVLIGPMAAGKSHLGHHFAKRYGLDFVDADHVIEAQHGPIPALFTAHGQQHFRDIEAGVVADLLADNRYWNAVISLGGGAPMTPAVQELLAGHTVIYLEVDEATVRPRITGNRTRPMLQPDPERRWREILDERRDTYERLATIRLDGTGHRRIGSLVQQLHKALTEQRRDATA